MKLWKKNPEKSQSEIELLRQIVTHCLIGGGSPLSAWQIFKLEWSGKRLAFGSKKWVHAAETWIELCKDFDEAKGAFFSISRIFTGQLRQIEPTQELELKALRKLLAFMVNRANKKEWRFCHRLAFDGSNYTLPNSEGRKLAVAKWNEFYRPHFVNTNDPTVAWDARLFCSASAENRPETEADIDQMAAWTKIVTDNDAWLQTR